MWKNEGDTRPAIVQSVNAVQRTALILFPDTGVIELASLLELDPHGHSDHDPTNPTASPDGFGVRRGDFVLIHASGSSNGMQKPRVPRIGEIEPWVRENPFTDGEYSGWRKELQELGSAIAAKRSADLPQEKMIQRPARGDGKIPWCGEVTAVCSSCSLLFSVSPSLTPRLTS
jgi:ubiquitin-conjugating enzyme E2 O